MSQSDARSIENSIHELQIFFSYKSKLKLPGLSQKCTELQSTEVLRIFDISLIVTWSTCHEIFQNGNESNILSNLIVSYFVLDWGRCSGHLTMTNDATDGTRLYTSRVIPQLLPAPSLTLERWWNALQLTSCHYCSSHAALQRPACCSPPLTPVTLLSASRCVTLFCLRS